MMSKNFKNWLSKYFRVVQLFLLALGTVLILSSTLASAGSQLERALFSLGTAVVSSTLLAIVYSILGADVRTIVEETLGVNRDLIDTGIEKVHLHIGDESIFDRFSRAHSIDLMYNTAKNASYRYGDRIAHAIAAYGCNVRILVSDWESPIWGYDLVRNGLCPGTNISQEVRDVLNHLEFLISELKEHQPPTKAGSIEVRKYSCAPTSSIVIVDGEFARHTPYLPYSHSSEVPIYDVIRKQNNGLLQQYQKAFDRVWNHSTTILKVNFSARRKSTP